MEKPLVLAVETSGRTGSAAVGRGDKVLAESVLSGHLRHGAELFTCCQRLLEQVGNKAFDVNQVYISAGPGSFTGVRIAATMAKIFSFANTAKIVPVSTMDVIFANAAEYSESTGADIRRAAVILDAKRRQFYVAGYEFTPSGWTKTVADCLMSSSDFRTRFGGGKETMWILGEGLVYYKEDFTAENISFMDESLWYPHARNVFRLGRKKALDGQFADGAELLPFYLRRPEATEKWEQKHG
jgi:tRNA threonylcarbamoyladenosine biosynthesis protein TsaB